MVRLFEKEATIYSISKETDIPRQTLKSWSNTFSTSNKEAKRICFFHNTGPPSEPLTQKMFCYFRKNGSGSLHKGAAIGMVHLHDSYNTPLY
ncbi:MAG: hypothetical protein GXY77_20500 [Fibrobacter sp.]|jgi:hypothetical protein|nr:hypothetical protein [Fibrobacter sp.]